MQKNETGTTQARDTIVVKQQSQEDGQQGRIQLYRLHTLPRAGSGMDLHPGSPDFHRFLLAQGTIWSILSFHLQTSDFMFLFLSKQARTSSPKLTCPKLPNIPMFVSWSQHDAGDFGIPRQCSWSTFNVYSPVTPWI